MTKSVTLTIDGKSVTVPQGTLIVDAAKRVGIDIPVFCYHPKLKPVGMCRMCLVEIARPLIDRASGEPLRDAEGRPKLQFAPKLETACTTPVAEGMVVITASDKVKAVRKDIIEFILTSHPLDCPVCDKGGECPLQNLTMMHGVGESRFLYDDKIHLAKHVPLGELIYLDRERCIQCGRCVRFQDEIVGEPVIGFFNRGRRLEIVTYSTPGFDSIFSGNTTDICPVGALTTSDFRFGARPWELKHTASICSHCPVGCNLTFDVRREAAAGGRIVIKRAMPRQNEAVNEIWLCDKGRFGYHYTEAAERLTTPLIRRNGELTPADWEEALSLVADRFRAAAHGLTILAGGRLPNEDLFNLRRMAEAVGGRTLLDTYMAGGDLTASLGVSPGTNLGDLGPDSAILIVACDLYHEAPLWYLRLKQAAERGATLIIANARPTRLEQYARHVVRYAYGHEAESITALLSANDQPAARAVASAENLLVFFGSDGLGLEGSHALAAACANLLMATGHTNRPNNGLIAVWPRANDQGAWEMGFRPPLADSWTAASAAYIVAADPFGDDPAFSLPPATFLVVQELFLTATARRADVVLPAQAFTEREGTFTSGERRVQRFYPATPPIAGPRPDYVITAQIGQRMGLALEARTPALVFTQLAAQLPAYAGLSHRKLAESADQWPAVGQGLRQRGLYFSGTAYENKQGIGISLPLSPAAVTAASLPDLRLPDEGLLAVPITRIYDRGQTLLPSKLLHQRIGQAWVALHPADAERLGLAANSLALLRLGGADYTLIVHLDERVPAGVALVPRSMGVPLRRPSPVELQPVEVVAS